MLFSVFSQSLEDLFTGLALGKQKRPPTGTHTRGHVRKEMKRRSVWVGRVGYRVFDVAGGAAPG